MATLTPGTLLKLLQSMSSSAPDSSSSSDVRPRRPAVLQVIGIAPALTASTADSLWPPSGFHLQLSDSSNSTFVALSGADADAVLSTRSQLGQLVYVDRLVYDSILPRAVGLRPVPCSRPQPCIGSPEALVVRSAGGGSRGFVIQPASPSDAAPPLMPSASKTASGDQKKEEPSTNSAGSSSGGSNKRRSASPAGVKLASRKEGSRDPSPAVTRAGSRSSSPVPSKCAVPSLIAAKEENRRTAKEAAIIVPSRYRQPSPSGSRRSTASPNSRRASLSPGRRLSGAMRGSPVESKKKVGVVMVGMSRGPDSFFGSSAKPGRKSWDGEGSAGGDGAAISSESSTTTTAAKTRSKVDKISILRAQGATSRRLSDTTMEMTSNGEQSTDEKLKMNSKRDSTAAVALTDSKWTDGSVSFDTVSPNLAKLGNEALGRRDAAKQATSEALQEALLTESIIRNLSIFADLSSTVKASSPLPAVDRFLLIYDDTLKWLNIAEQLVAGRSGKDAGDAACFESSASLLVEAAMAADIEAMQIQHCDPKKLAKKAVKKPGGSSSSSRAEGVKESVALATALRQEMQQWFLKFVDEALDVGFVLFGGSGAAKENSRVTTVLSQFKRINDWLDGIGRAPPAERATKEKVERLKRKIYGFVITNMGSAFENSMAASKC